MDENLHSLNVSLVLDHILCIDEGDGAGNAEPYLWALFFKIDGETVRLENGRLRGTVTVDRRNGEHGNLQNRNVNARDFVPIPDYIGKWETTLVPIPAYNEAGELINDLSLSGIIGVLCVLMEEDETSNKAAMVGYTALCSLFESKMNAEINKLGFDVLPISEEQISAISSAVAEAAENAVTEASKEVAVFMVGSWIQGPPLGFMQIGAPDDFIGSANFRYQHDDLEKGKQFFFERYWEQDGEWKISGHISATIVPQFIGEFGQIIVFEQEEMAMRDFRHRAEVAEREGFAGAFPNFYTATYGSSNVGGTIFITAPCGVARDVKLDDLGNPPLDDFAERFRATHVYATKQGFVGGFPNFFHAEYSTLISRNAIALPPKFSGVGGNNALNPRKPILKPVEVSVMPSILDGGNPIVCGTVLIKSSCATFRDVPLTELGNPLLSDIGARFRATQDYATQQGFVGGFPNFFHFDHGNGIVCGTILFKPGAAEWRDVLLFLGPA